MMIFKKNITNNRKSYVQSSNFYIKNSKISTDQFCQCSFWTGELLLRAS